MAVPEFISFPKIQRLSNEKITITEKIHGSNGQIAILPIDPDQDYPCALGLREYDGVVHGMFAGSRNRWLTPNNDNMGFARWVVENSPELWGLEPGRHYGEWFGSGVQKQAYSRVNGEKDFALFNVHRWGEHNPNTPKCCMVVPTLYQGSLVDGIIHHTMKELFKSGSHMGGDYVEGVIVYYHLTKQYMKKTFEQDNGKWAK